MNPVFVVGIGAVVALTLAKIGDYLERKAWFKEVVNRRAQGKHVN